MAETRDSEILQPQSDMRLAIASKGEFGADANALMRRKFSLAAGRDAESIGAAGSVTFLMSMVLPAGGRRSCAEYLPRHKAASNIASLRQIVESP
jgi:hypothetical protein